MTKKELSEAFEDLNQLKILASTIANKKSLTQSHIKIAISICEDEYNYYKYIYSKERLFSGELTALRMVISKLKDRLE